LRDTNARKIKSINQYYHLTWPKQQTVATRTTD